jgi:uncharacterized repeat protein (TIGR04076 family)
MQRHLGYSDEEIKIFKENPRNSEVLDKRSVMMNKTLILEVVESQGCNSQHRVGDKFFFDGAGNLLNESSPKKICVFSLSSAATLIFTASEMIYAGVDPNEIRFKRTGCFDVGLACGGWGRIVLELRVEDRSS